MSHEFYTINWTGKELEYQLKASCPITLDSEANPPKNWKEHLFLGRYGEVWCASYRNSKDAGGLFVMQDADEVLFIAQASTNMAFVQALSQFSQVVSNPRYAADIFDNADDDDDEE